MGCSTAVQVNLVQTGVPVMLYMSVKSAEVCFMDDLDTAYAEGSQGTAEFHSSLAFCVSSVERKVSLYFRSSRSQGV